MKNKKLFAILTLVCFMFTLMPVAAFAAYDPAKTTYAEVNEDTKVVGYSDDIVLDMTNADTTTKYYVFAMKDGDVNKQLRFAELQPSSAGKITVSTDINAGTYDMYVVDKNIYTDNIIAEYTAGRIDRAAAAASLIKESNVVMLDKTVTIDPVSSTYTLAVQKTSADDLDGDLTDANIVMKADGAYTEVDVWVELSGADVVGKELTVATNSSAITATPETVKTNAAGLAKFTVTASIAGDFKVYVNYGKAKTTVNVTVGGMDASTVMTVAQPTAPVALDTELNDVKAYFAAFDANGNDAQLSGNYKVVVTEKPAGSKLPKDTLTLTPVTGKGYGFATTNKLDKEGTYTFRVVLDNGNYTTATVEVKEFQTPVELKVTYDVTAVELGGNLEAPEVVFVDANGVTDAAAIGTDVVLSATGYAISSFAADGALVVKNNEDYVGSKITVFAYSDTYNLTDTVELTVANEAAGVKWANTNADVAVNNTIVANIVDVDGNKVALSTTPGAISATDIKYIVLEKPENAKVSVVTKGGSAPDLAGKGEFKVSFTASTIGEYKVQTVVTYNQGGGVVKYYSGIEEITVGNTGFEDVVVMSIGSSTIVVNADAKAIDAAPMIENGRTFVPFRALAEAFGATVAYDEATQAVTAELDGITVVMTVGSATYTVNGVEATADVAPFIVDGRTMVPVRFVAEAFGITVTPTYDENGATADVIFAK